MASKVTQNLCGDPEITRKPGVCGMTTKRIKFGTIVNDIPLSYKFYLIYIVGVLLPIMVLNLVFLERITDLIKSREQQNLEISMERARKDIHDFIEGGSLSATRWLRIRTCTRCWTALIRILSSSTACSTNSSETG